MIKKIIFDSSVLIPLIYETDPVYHSHSKELFDFVARNKTKIVLPMTVLFEVFHVIKKLGFFDRDGAHEIFLDFFNYPYFKYLNLNLSFFNFFKQADVFDNLKTSDAIIAASAFLTESVLITWDKRLIKNSYGAYTPEDFLKNFA